MSQGPLTFWLRILLAALATTAAGVIGGGPVFALITYVRTGNVHIPGGTTRVVLDVTLALLSVGLASALVPPARRSRAGVRSTPPPGSLPRQGSCT